MSERIYILPGDSIPQRFLLSTIAASNLTDDPIFMEESKRDKGCISVDLRVNGRSVSFTKIIEAWWKRCEEQLDKNALEEAKKLVTAAGLERIQDALLEAENLILSALEEQSRK